MIFIGDYHIHSNYSDGRASIDEMVNAGIRRGLKEIAITDHGPKNFVGGLKNAEKLLEVAKITKIINKNLKDFKVLSGVEANIIDGEGNIDVPKEIYEKLDILIIGLHPFIFSFNPSTAWNLLIKNQAYKYLNLPSKYVIDYNTTTLQKACIKHKPFAVSHPGLGMPVNVSEIAKTCVETNTAYEINCGHLYQKPEELEEAAATGVEFVINSDAHFTDTVGKLEPGLELAKKAGISMSKIRNVYLN